MTATLTRPRPPTILSAPSSRPVRRGRQHGSEPHAAAPPFRSSGQAPQVPPGPKAPAGGGSLPMPAFYVARIIRAIFFAGRPRHNASGGTSITEKRVRVNEQIRISPIRLIDDEGNQVG